METKQRYIVLLLLLILTLVGSWAGEAVQYPFRHLTTADGLLNNEIKGLSFDRQGILWVETQTGWNSWDGKDVKVVGENAAKPADARPSTANIRRWSNIILPATSHSKQQESAAEAANTILDVKDDGHGHLWIATDHEGVFIYDKSNKKFTNLVNAPNQPTTIAENHVSVIAIAKDGTVALGHIKKGVSIYKPSPFRLTHFQSTTWRNVSCVFEDSKHNIWVGTDGYGLFNVTRRDHYDIPGNIVVTLMEDMEGRLWIGTYKEGLLCMENGKVLHQYNKENSRLSDNNVYSLFQDKSGRIWIGTLFGWLQTFDPKTGEWTDYRKESNSESIVMDFAPDANGCLYAGTLWGVSHINTKTGKCEQLFSNHFGKPFLHADVQSLLKDSRGFLWIAHGKGITIWNLKNDSLYYLTKEQGLCDDVIRSLCEDTQGRVLVGTSNGLSVVTVSSKDGKTTFIFDNYTTDRGLLDNNISRHSIIRLHDGNLLMGSYEGYTLVNVTGKSNDIENMTPYEIGEEWTVWTSWQAIIIYIVLVLSILATYLLMRRARKKAIAKAIRKAQEIWAKNPMKDEQFVSVMASAVEQPSAEPVTTEPAQPAVDEKPEPKPVRKTIEVAPTEIEITSRDEELVKRAICIVEKHISDEFSVEDLSKEVGLTRGHLYKKLTALTGKTPVEFIRTIRMKRACQLLEQSGMQVSEVAYAVGYSSPKIFSRNFKAEMGMTPTEYMEKVKK